MPRAKVFINIRTSFLFHCYGVLLVSYSELERIWMRLTWVNFFSGQIIIFKNIPFSLDKTFDDATVDKISGYESHSCLTIEMVLESNSPTFMRASCFNTSNYVCEVRVQTVTYYAWFLANWFSVLMVNSIYKILNRLMIYKITYLWFVSKFRKCFL